MPKTFKIEGSHPKNGRYIDQASAFNICVYVFVIGVIIGFLIGLVV